MTGVSIDTLRAWERRYGAVTPRRDDRGRVYSEADVRRISLLRDAVNGGHAIGRVAAMTDEQLLQIARAAAQSASPAPHAATPAVDLDAIIAALERFDAPTVEAHLARAAALLGAPELLRDVVLPALVEVGERWHAARGRVAHEHMLSASVRNVLGSLMRLHMKTTAAERLLFATPAGERHEFGTLGAAMLATSGGLGTIYLGPDMPADDIVAVTEVVPVEVVVLGVTGASDTARVNAEVKQVAERLSPRIELWLGGPHAHEAAARLHGRALALASYDALVEQLTRLGATF